MKAVILAGGRGTRISEETHLKPKPMIEIGGMPILWHIMKIYSHHGIRDFIICCGYKGYLIKEYFANYFLHTSDLTINISDNVMNVHRKHAEEWKVTLVDTGEATMTGGRLRRVAPYLSDDEVFCFTYGDGVADINITELLSFHRQKARLATLTAVHPPARFGALDISSDGRVESFREKPTGDDRMINGGFFVLSSKVIDLLTDDTTIWEQEPLETLADTGQLSAYQHRGFWQPLDTLRDRVMLNDLWVREQAPWKIW